MLRNSKKTPRKKALKGKATTMMTIRSDLCRIATSAKCIALRFSLLFTLAARAGDPLTLVQTIPLPGVTGRFDHFSIDAKAARLFVAALGNNTVEVIDLTTGKRLQSIPGMSKPQGVLYLSSANQILVANGDDGTLKTLDANGFGVRHNLPN